MTNDAAQQLKNIRTQIDQIDNDINTRLLQRFSLAHQIADIKTKNQLPFYQPDREKMHIAELMQTTPNEHHEKLTRMWREIMTLSLLEQIQIRCHLLTNYFEQDFVHCVYRSYSPRIELIQHEKLDDHLIESTDLVIVPLEEIATMLQLNPDFKIINKITSDSGRNLYVFCKTHPKYLNLSYLYWAQKDATDFSAFGFPIEKHPETSHLLIEITETQHQDFQDQMASLDEKPIYLGNIPI